MKLAVSISAYPGDVIILPADSALQTIQEWVGVDTARMKKLPSWNEFQESVTFRDQNLFQLQSGTYTNGHRTINIDFDQQQITVGTLVVNILAVYDYQNEAVKLIAIDSILLSQELKDKFVAEFWSMLPPDMFFLLAANVNPRDVLRLCSVSKTLASRCTIDFYRKMLRTHYNKIAPDPKAAFISMSKVMGWSCGNGSFGELGHGDERKRLIPAKIEALQNVVAISAGSLHSLFLDKDGHVLSCGWGKDGQLGHGYQEGKRLSSARIEALQNVVAIGAGTYHSLFLDRDGHVWSCGPGGFGRLGHGDKEDRLIPTRIEALQNVVAISAGVVHSLFLDKDGSVWSCGNAGSGQLGHGDHEERLIPTRIETLGNVVAVSAGGPHSLFLDRDGQVWSCGRGREGQLGHGDEKKRLIPTKIESLRNVIAISAGSLHSLFLDKDGQVWSCGGGEYGRLGHGDREGKRLSPARIESLQNVIAISGGGAHSLFLDRNGRVWSCGRAREGQLGHGNEEDRFIPTRIETLQNVIAIDAGENHSLFLA